jgi:hypothetical protein
MLTPANFYHFRRPKFNFQPLSFAFETFGKKLAVTKIVARINVKKIKAKKLEKRLLNCLRWSGNDFLPKFVDNGKSWGFFGRCWGFAEMLWVKISSECPAWIGLGTFFQKNTIFMPFYGDIFRVNFFDLKNSINRQNNGDLEPLKGFGINFFWSNHPRIYLNLSWKMIKQGGDH